MYRSEDFECFTAALACFRNEARMTDAAASTFGGEAAALRSDAKMMRALGSEYLEDCDY